MIDIICNVVIIIITMESYLSSVVAHKDSVSTMTANNYKYLVTKTSLCGNSSIAWQ